MEVALGAVLGLVLGWGATRIHPRVNAGALVAAAAGILGGLAGQAWLGPVLTPRLAEQELAGAAAGGAVGGLVLAPLVSFVIRFVMLRRRRRAI